MKPEHTFKEYVDCGEISVKGGNLNDDYKIHVIIGYDGVTRRDLLKWCSGGQSVRVKLQATLREKTKEDMVKNLERTGLAIHARDVAEPFKSDEDRMKEAIAAVMALNPNASYEQVRAFVEANMPKKESTTTE